MYESKTPSNNLVEYIIKNVKKGYTIDSLKVSLLSRGYTRISIENAISHANIQMADELPKIKEKPKITVRIVDDNVQGKFKESPKIKKGFWKRLFSKFY